MVNTPLLDERISQSGLRVGYIVDTLGLSRQAFDKKKKNKTRFKKAEIFVLSILLKLSDAEQERIFYANEVES